MPIRSRLLPLLLLAACAGPELPFATARAPSSVQQVEIPGPEGVTLRALLALPEGPATGAVVVALHGCSGLAPPNRRLRLPLREADWAARLTEAGHPVVFPDSFGSRGLGGGCGVRGFPVSPEGVRREDARATAAWAAAQPWALPGGVVLLGWSHGGSATLAAVAAPLPPGQIRAAIALYPGCGTLSRAGGWVPAVPVLQLLGAADDWTPPGLCQDLAAGHAGQVETVLYSGAAHGFDHPGQPMRSHTLPNGRMVTMGSDPAGRADALRRVVGFLGAHGGVAP
jgi:dienelactone hydrolase